MIMLRAQQFASTLGQATAQIFVPSPKQCYKSFG
jgi:hypothetical protein